jgi:glyoxylase-like metal-dependent hydrolase (beta-lactamase superfamily II)
LEIVDGIYLIKNPHRHYFVSSCLIVGDSLTLVDAGREESPEDSIYPYIRGLGRDPLEISLVILTHAHWDHCAGAARIKRDSGCKVAVHRNGMAYLKDPELLNRERSARFPGVPRRSMEFETVEPDIDFLDGDVLPIQGRNLRVVHTSGHSPCSCCIVEEEHGIFIAGDSIQGKGEGRPLIFHSVDAYVDSMKRLQDMPIEVIVSGHPFPPSKKAVLRGEETSVHIRESLSAVEELRNLVRGALEKSRKPMNVIQVHEATSVAPLFTIGCILEALVAEGEAQRVKIGNEQFWVA